MHVTQKPKVSVIMAAYNGEKYIAEAIESVLSQTFRNLELIIVDDGSTDQTCQIVKRLQANEHRIRYVYQQNGGQGKARNTAIGLAEGEFIAFLDQDDLWIETKLDHQIKVICETGVDVVFSDGFIFQDSQSRDEATSFSTICGMFDSDTIFNLLIIQNRIPILTVLVRKEALSRANKFEESKDYQGCDDYELWLRMARNAVTFYGISEKLVRYRLHQNQNSKHLCQMLKAEIAVVEKHKRENSEERQRLISLRKRAAIAILDQYFQKAREGQIASSIPYFIEAIELSPYTVLQPHRFGAVVKNMMQAIFIKVSGKVSH